MAESPIQTGSFSYSGMINRTSDSTATYYYSDSYFDHSAQVYDPHLATMSFCLEASVWSSKNTDIWPEKTQNARALLNELAFKDIYQNAAWDQKPSMHSLGLVLAYKNIGSTTLVAAVIRGGGYYSEWGGNLVVGSQGDHEGFSRGSQIALQELEQYVERHCESGDFQPCLKLWIVGFSRGGAVAEMTAAHLTDQKACGSKELTADNIYAYTFEAPQGHFGEERTYANIHNIIDPMDIVPLVAPEAMGFHRFQRTSTLIVPLLGTKDYELRRDTISRQYAQVLTSVAPVGITIPEDKMTYAPSPYVMAVRAGALDDWLNAPDAEPRWE